MNSAQRLADAGSRHVAAFLGFSIPLSTALDNALLVLLALLWLAAGNLKAKFAAIAGNPVAVAALLLFGMLAAGLLYGDPAPGDGLRYLAKYDKLLFIPVIIACFLQARTRELALRWFCAAMVLTFVVAELVTLGLLDGNPLLNRAPGYTGAFKPSISHGLLCAFSAYLFALLALRDKRWPWRALYIVLALVAVKNVAFIAISRTAYIVLALLALHFAWSAFRLRGLLIAGLAGVILAVAAYAGSATFRMRVDTLVSSAGNERGMHGVSRESVLQRLDWYKRSLEVVSEHPVLGVGTGAAPRALAGTATEARPEAVQNPHNEYLMIALQTGLVGLALLLHLFARQLRLARRLASPFETQLAYGLLITMATGCLFNSFLLDHTEGLFYVWLTGVLYSGLLLPRAAASPGHLNGT